jgi:hypothetical protein
MRAFMNAESEEANLVGEEAPRGHTDLGERDGQERHRDLLSRGDERVHLPRVRTRGELLAEGDEAIRLTRHRRGHDDDVVARGTGRCDASRDGLDALDGTDAGTAVLLHEELPQRLGLLGRRLGERRHARRMIERRRAASIASMRAASERESLALTHALAE